MTSKQIKGTRQSKIKIKMNKISDRPIMVTQVIRVSLFRRVMLGSERTMMAQMREVIENMECNLYSCAIPLKITGVSSQIALIDAFRQVLLVGSSSSISFRPVLAMKTLWLTQSSILLKLLVTSSKTACPLAQARASSTIGLEYMQLPLQSLTAKPKTEMRQQPMMVWMRSLDAVSWMMFNIPTASSPQASRAFMTANLLLLKPSYWKARQKIISDLGLYPRKF